MSKRKKLRVEDHGNGFMVIGTALVPEAARELCKYAEDPGSYRFATPTHYNNESCVWLTTAVGEFWEGAQHAGFPIPRSW